MKPKNLLISCVLLICIPILMVSCSKTGATGPKGDIGLQGPLGPQGPKGDTGTANVVYSDWLDETFTPNTDSSVWTATIVATKLSNTILASGEMKVFLNLNTAASPQIVPLPFFNGGVILNPLFALQSIKLISNTDASTISNTSGKFQQYRYILIPGGVHGAVSPVNWNNYDQVARYLGISN